MNFPSVAFGRLCVETKFASDEEKWIKSVAFGRLCVETLNLG